MYNKSHIALSRKNFNVKTQKPKKKIIVLHTICITNHI